MIAIKFGGSSIADADKIKHVGNLVRKMIEKKPVIVVSAIGTTTDDLIEAGMNALKNKINLQGIQKVHKDIADELEIDFTQIKPLFDEIHDLLLGISLIKELSRRTLDYLISFGERLSARMIATYLNNINVSARFIDAWELGLITDSNFNNAEILEETYENIRANLSMLESNYNYTPVITGFIGKDHSGNITTLGRGGSDLTVSIVGSALAVEEIQLWKDVDGLLTCDPKKAENPALISCISFEEASELAYFGAKVLHPRSILPAMKSGIPVLVKSYLNPEADGTKIINNFVDENELLRAITYKKNITVVDIVSTRMLGNYGFLANVFRILSELKISVDVVATSEVSISFTLDYDKNIEALQNELLKIACVNVKKGNAIISLIGNVYHSSEILNKTFTILNELKINVQMLSQGASKVNISFIVNDEHADICIKEIHKQFFEGGTK